MFSCFQQYGGRGSWAVVQREGWVGAGLTGSEGIF